MAGCSCHRHLAGWLQLSQTAASWLPVTRQASEVQSCLRSDCCSSPVCCARRAHVRNIKSLCVTVGVTKRDDWCHVTRDVWRVRDSGWQCLHQCIYNLFTTFREGPYEGLLRLSFNCPKKGKNNRGLHRIMCKIILRRCHDCLTSDLAETSRRVTTRYVGAEELPLPGTPAWPGLGAV